MTLIEVMVGLAILGTLLTSLVLARSRYLHQWAIAGRKQDAVAAADALLTRWASVSAEMPRHDSGLLTDKQLRWTTQELNVLEVKIVNAQVIRLTIFDDRPTANLSDSTAIITVDLLASIPTRKEKQKK